ncbi:MAG TPA: hypothetical protein V6D30_09655 [Leptolyngbyaceae cyanobacterium]
MALSNLETPETFSLLFQNKIESLRQKHERDYASSHNEAFNLAVARLFSKLASLMTFSTSSKSVAAARFQQAADLVAGFTSQYQEVYSPEFGVSLKHLSNFFRAHQKFFEAFALLDAAHEEKDQAVRYTHYRQGFQLFGELIDEYWYALSVEVRSDFEEFARDIQNKTGFGAEKTPWGEVKQSWKELKQQLSLFGASVKSGGVDLFTDYKQAVVYCTSSILKAAEQDRELQAFKEAQKSVIIWEYPKTNTPDAVIRKESVYVPVTESERHKKVQELIELLRTWRDEDSQ